MINKNRQIFLAAMAVSGVAGWVMLVIPELHFIYKELMPILGKGKYLAFILMGAAMFICLPVFITQKLVGAILPAYRGSWPEKIVMGGAIILSVLLSRSFM
ncbi:MAG: hypothetical protein QF526_02260 [Alphaproteobacteria bacterium]|nr:hypothetical protein [Alphaproteobacteria bacterium]